MQPGQFFIWHHTTKQGAQRSGAAEEEDYQFYWQDRLNAFKPLAKQLSKTQAGWVAASRSEEQSRPAQHRDLHSKAIAEAKSRNFVASGKLSASRSKGRRQVDLLQICNVWALNLSRDCLDVRFAWRKQSDDPIAGRKWGGDTM